MNAVKTVFLSNLLYEAIQDVNFNAVKMLLIEKCANPNCLLPKRGISSLHLAIGIDPYRFAIDCTRLILENGGNPNVRSEEGLTPLHIAVSLNRIDLIELLLTYGANTTVGDGTYNSPLDYATEDNFTDVLSRFHSIKPSNRLRTNDDTTDDRYNDDNRNNTKRTSDTIVKTSNSTTTTASSSSTSFKFDSNTTNDVLLTDSDDSTNRYHTNKVRKKPKRITQSSTNNDRVVIGFDLKKKSYRCKSTSDESGISSTIVIDDDDDDLKRTFHIYND